MKTCWKVLAPLLLVSIVFTAAIVSYSVERGKLAAPPTWNDSSYLAEGMNHLALLRSHGTIALLRELIEVPPHALGQSVVAAIGFSLFGDAPRSPYYLNAAWVLVILVFCHRLLKGLSLWTRSAVLACVLATPFTVFSVYDFEPDYPTAICTAIAAWLTTEEKFTRASRRYRFGVGLLFGVALLFKPTVSPFTLCMAGVAATLAYWQHRPRSLRTFAPAALGMVLVAAPYYAVTLPHTFRYVAFFIWGEGATIWRSPDTPSAFAYFLTGPGSLRLGLFLYPFLVAVAASFTKMTRHQRTTLFLASFAFAFCTLNPGKNPLLGLTFQFLLLLNAVAIVPTLAKAQLNVKAGLAIALVATAPLHWAQYGLPMVGEFLGLPATEAHAILDKIIKALREDHESRGVRGKREGVLVATNGVAGMGTVQWALAGDLRFNIVTRFDRASFERDAQNFRYVITADPTAQGVMKQFSAGALTEHAVGYLDRQPNFVKLAEAQPSIGKGSYLLYRRNGPASR